MGIIPSITSSRILALDTNIFILAYDRKTAQAEAARKLLIRIKEANPRVFISVIAFEEFLIKIYKKGWEDNVSHYEDFLTAGGVITVVNIDREIARKAAKIRATYPSVRTPDAIHIASAIQSGATLFITADRRLPKKIGRLAIKSL